MNLPCTLLVIGSLDLLCVSWTKVWEKKFDLIPAWRHLPTCRRNLHRRHWHPVIKKKLFRRHWNPVIKKNCFEWNQNVIFYSPSRHWHPVIKIYNSDEGQKFKMPNAWMPIKYKFRNFRTRLVSPMVHFSFFAYLFNGLYFHHTLSYNPPPSSYMVFSFVKIVQDDRSK